MIPYVQEKEKEPDQESIVSYDYEKAKEIKWYDRLLLNRPLKVILALLLISIVVPILIYRFVFFTTMDAPPSDGYSFGSCLVPRNARVPCGAGAMPQGQCHSQCCYDLETQTCFHRFPSRFSYLLLDGDWTEESVLTPRFPTTPFASQRSVTSLRLSIDEISPTHLSIHIYDPRLTFQKGSRIENATYNYRVTSPELNIIVNSTQGTIFNTIRGPLIASDNIWEMVFKLTEESMYGLGELPLRAGASKVVYNHPGGLSAVPLIFAKSNGSYHGLLVDIKNPSEIWVGMENQISLKSLTKTGLKLHIFVGPEPKDIMRDVMSVVGQNEKLDYWMLGAHVCSEMSDDDDEALAYLTSFVANATRDGLPYESHCGTKPIVFNSNATDDATTVEAGARIVRNAGGRFVPHLAPYIHYVGNGTYNKTDDIGSNMTCDIICEYGNSMLQSSDGLYLGLVNDNDVIYPDYWNDYNGLLNRLWTYDLALDGAFLVNSWPLDQSWKPLDAAEESLPYFNENFRIAFNDTPKWNTSWNHAEDYFYHHNEYGSRFVEAIKRTFNTTPIYSTSLWMKNNAGINRQNIQTSWTSLRRELVEAALGGISGHWLWSSPICGDTEHFDSDVQGHICVKWYQAATYLPMIKIHSKYTSRDPSAFDRTRQNLMIQALNERLKLMPYFHTVLQDGPLLRPMFYQFPHSNVSDLNTQFSVGDHLLIAPNLQPSQTHVHVRMPPGTWFEFSSGLKVDAKENEPFTLTTTESDFITLICSRSIVVTQKDVRRTAELTRRNSPLSLTIAIERVRIINSGLFVIESYHAVGSLYISPNMTANFELNDKELEITSVGEDFDKFCGATPIWAKTINEIRVYGLDNDQNNYDTYKLVTTNIDLCELKNGSIVYKLL